MSYVQRTVVAGTMIVRAAALVIAFLVACYAALLAYFWWVSRPIEYVMRPASSASGSERSIQLAELEKFRSHGACEHIGKPVEIDGQPALWFSVHPDFEREDVACIRAATPAGFRLEKSSLL